jgi:hypothetical protein
MALRLAHRKSSPQLRGLRLTAKVLITAAADRKVVTFAS